MEPKFAQSDTFHEQKIFFPSSTRYSLGNRKAPEAPRTEMIKSDGQEISTIEWQDLKNRFPSFFVY